MIIMNTVLKIREEEETVHKIVDSFYSEYKHNSASTARAYRADVESFLESQTPLGLETPLDTIANYINYSTVTNYRTAEIERGLQATSINRKVTVLKEFAKHLRVHSIEVLTDFFDNIKPLKGGGDSYEVLTIPEAVMIAEWLRDNEKRLAKLKYYYVLLATDTGIRADALAKLTPKNFVELEDEVLVKGIDKGKKRFNKRISKSLYQEMKDSLPEWSADSKPLFNFSSKNRTDMIRRALKGLGWEERNIAFHSFKKAAVNNAFESTGDIRVAMKVGAHESVNTTQRYIADGESDFLGAISNSNLKKIKELDYDDFSKEELVKAVEQLSKHQQYNLKNILIKNSNKA